MSVVVFAENWAGKFKKGTYEAVGVAADMAAKVGGGVTAVVIGNVEDDVNALGKYGASTVVKVALNDTHFDPHTFAGVLASVAEEKGAKAMVVSGTTNGKALSGALAVKWGGALVSNTVEVPESVSPLKVKRKCFSSKGFAFTTSNADKVIVSHIPNSIGVKENETSVSVEEKSMDVTPGTKSVSIDRVTGKTPLPEAELVVSAGRGMKGPENWNLIEDLAEVLGAGTACSKPVSDMGWRPHSEHVGQTGIAINPQLYIAVGISGAIQHLAGVSASKNIVVINKDPEAPFFKSADYGIVGDAFEVVPKLTEALRAYKANS